MPTPVTQRQRAAPERYDPIAYTKTGQLRNDPKADEPVCFDGSYTMEEDDCIQCDRCGDWYHLLRANLKAHPKRTFECHCRDQIVKDDAIIDEKPTAIVDDDQTSSSGNTDDTADDNHVESDDGPDDNDDASSNMS